MTRRLPGGPFRNRKKPSCKDVGKVLQTYLDGEMDDRDMAAVQVHLDACVDCGLEASTFEVLRSAITARRSVVDPDVLDSLRAFSENITAGKVGGSGEAS